MHSRNLTFRTLIYSKGKTRKKKKERKKKGGDLIHGGVNEIAVHAGPWIYSSAMSMMCNTSSSVFTPLHFLISPQRTPFNRWIQGTGE